MEDNTSVETLVDTRKFNKSSKALLKSSVSIDKSLRNNLELKLKSKSSTTEKNNHLRDISFFESLSEGLSQATIPQFEPITKQEEFNNIAWIAFEKFSIKPNRPFDGTKLGLPIDRLFDSLMEIYPMNHVWERIRLNISTILKQLEQEKTTIISWHDFKTILESIKALLKKSDFTESPPSPNRVAANAISYNTLVHKQRMVCSISDEQRDYLQTKFTEPSETIINLQNKIVPINYLKDAVVDVFKKDDVIEQLEQQQAKSSPLLHKTTPSPTFSRAPSFDDSIVSNKFPFDYGAASKYKKDERPVPHSRHEVHKSKVLGLVNTKDEYYFKWLHMKQLRDERYAREYKKRVRNDLIHTFQRFIVDTTKNENALHDKEQRRQDKITHQNLTDSINQRRNQLKDSLKHRMEFLKERKLEEKNYIKFTLQEAIHHQNESMKFEEKLRRSEHRKGWSSHHYEGVGDGEEEGGEVVGEGNGMHDSLSTSKSHSIGWDSDHESSIGTVPSYVVDPPPELVERVKSAKSLTKYKEAQQDLTQFIEDALDGRIHDYKVNRGIAQMKASQPRSPMTIHPIPSPDHFDIPNAPDRDYNPSSSLVQSIAEMSNDVPKIQNGRSSYDELDLESTVISEKALSHPRLECIPTKIDTTPFNDKILQSYHSNVHHDPSLHDVRKTELRSTLQILHNASHNLAHHQHISPSALVGHSNGPSHLPPIPHMDRINRTLSEDRLRNHVHEDLQKKNHSKLAHVHSLSSFKWRPPSMIKYS